MRDKKCLDIVMKLIGELYKKEVFDEENIREIFGDPDLIISKEK